MKCTIPEISWHNRDPVLSVDIQPKKDQSDIYRLATGGTDSHVLIWYMTPNESGSVTLDVAADLTRHQRAVNTVKWSPNGNLLASGDDESVIFLWKLKAESEPNNILDITSEQDKEIWLIIKVLRGHMEDVYDLSWSPDSQFLVSGSVDNTAMIWDVNKGKSIAILNDHKGFVQGVAWDPKNQYIATLSTDRILRIFDINTKRVVSRTSKCNLPVLENDELFEKKIRIFHDDTLQTFFRRLCFSPDGKLIVTPSGVIDYDGVNKPMNTTYVFSRYALKQPSIVLPSLDQYTVAVKFCPILFKLRSRNDESSKPVVPLPYRMIFAIATKSSVHLYDTQQKMPFGLISNIHYTRLTDLAWSSNGRILIVSSTDGFCSLVTFTEGELGEVYEDVTELSELSDVNDKKIENKKNNQIDGSNEKTDMTTKNILNPDITNKENDDTDIKNEITLKELPKPNIIEKLADEIIIDKNIICSDDKFESPEKKSRPITPISVRRHPRTPGGLTPTGKDSLSITTPTLNEHVAKKELSAKKPKPIATRHTRRSLVIPAVEKTTFVEEAMDAWPQEHSKNQSELTPTKKIIEPVPEPGKKPKTPLRDLEEFNNCTEDIRLVYEDSQDEEGITKKTNNCCNISNEEPKSVKPEENQMQTNNISSPVKTPRRVLLKTISTPKSKKKLIPD